MAFRDKDHKGIKQFYIECWPEVRQLIIRNNGSEEAAKDIMQSAMASLYINIRSGKFQVRNETRIQSYFLQICKYKWYDRLKSAHNRLTESITSSEYRLSNEDELHSFIEQEDRSRYIARYLEQMGDKCRELLQLFYWEDYTLQQIAAKFSYTEESAKNAKYRCLKKLKSLINPQKSQK